MCRYFHPSRERSGAVLPWSIKHVDVTNAFLHGIIDQTVYMKQSLGYKDPYHPTFVCKLSKALYGLR